MEYEEIEQLPFEITEEEVLDEEDCLDEAELNRIAFLAEEPELTDPVFLFIRKRGRFPRT